MWDTRYRPLVFDDVLGQGGSVKVLRSRLNKGEAFDTSYIFSGGHGSGKTTLARILARAMLCQNPHPEGDPCNECDHCKACLAETMPAFVELDAASQGTTADMRSLVDLLSYDVPGVPKRIYLLDEAHRMSRDAQDVLLKPIEDKKVVLLFCTTEFGKIRGTIKSRCEHYEIRKIRREEILERAKLILTHERVGFEDEAILTVVDFARGHVRDVLNQLETIAQLGPITMEAVRERLDLSVISLYYDILLALGNASAAIELIEGACDRVGAPQVVAGLAEAAMNAFRHANKIHTDYSQLDQERAARVFERFGAEVTAIARYFLSLGSNVSPLDLVCAAVAFNGASCPAPVVAAPVPAPPVVIAIPSVAAPAPAPVSVVAPASPPLATMPLPTKPSPTVVRGSTWYPDNDVPGNFHEASQMQTSELPKGAGHSNPPYKPAVKAEVRVAPEAQTLGFTRTEFTAAFFEYMGICGATSHGN